MPYQYTELGVGGIDNITKQGTTPTPAENELWVEFTTKLDYPIDPDSITGATQSGTYQLSGSTGSASVIKLTANHVYTGYGGSAGGKVSKVNRSDLSVEWETTAFDGFLAQIYDLLIVDGIVYAQDNGLAALDDTDGSEYWNTSISTQGTMDNGKDHIYIATEDGVKKIKSGTGGGNIVSTFNQGTAYYTVSIYNDRVFAVRDSGLDVFDKSGNNISSTENVPQNAGGAQSHVGRGSLYVVGLFNQFVAKFDIDTLTREWTLSIGSGTRIFSSDYRYGSMFVSTDAAQLVYIDDVNGTVQRTIDINTEVNSLGAFAFDGKNAYYGPTNSPEEQYTLDGVSPPSSPVEVPDNRELYISDGNGWYEI